MSFWTHLAQKNDGEAFFWLITHLMLLRVSSYLCHSWNQWAVDKKWGDYWKMPEKTIPLKHFIWAKIICLKCWILHIEITGCRSGGPRSNESLASFEIGRLKESRSEEPRVNPHEGIGTLQEGGCRVKAGSSSGLRRITSRSSWVTGIGIFERLLPGRASPGWRWTLGVFILVFNIWNPSWNRSGTPQIITSRQGLSGLIKTQLHGEETDHSGRGQQRAWGVVPI